MLQFDHSKSAGPVRLRTAMMMGGALIGGAVAWTVAYAQGAGSATAPAGRAAYVANCASCHGAGLDDGEFGPPLKGPSFHDRWLAQPPEQLLSYITSKMPPVGPGTLSSQTYAAIHAYLLTANGAAASARPEAAATPAAPAAAAPGAANAPRGPRGVQRDAVYTATVNRRQAVLDAVTPVTDQTLKAPPAGDWLMWRRTYQSSGFSPLSAINRANVESLRTEWSWSLPLSQNEITPVVHDGVLFIESGNAIQALNAATGELLWQHIHPLPEELSNGRNSRIKALAIYGSRVYAPTADGHLLALDIKSGKVVWDHAVITAEQSARNGRFEGVALLLNGGPIIAKGKVVIGVSLGQSNGRGGCYIVALDAETGKESWRFNTIARPGEPGGDSWNGHPVEERFGAGVWTAGSYDPERNLVYFGTGNTYDTATLLEPNPKVRPENYGLYTNTTLALDVDTGKLRWHYQHVRREVWDLDWVFERSLVTLPVNGKPRDLLITGGKIALFEALDRSTGQYVFSKDLGLQNLVTAVDPVTGEKTINPAVEPEAGKPKLLCPNSLGARNWPATSIDPSTHIMYVPLTETCTDFTYMPRSPAETAAGGSDIRFGPRERPGADGNFGRVDAIDLVTRKVVWSRRQRASMASSMLVTAGKVLFAGSRDRRFSAFDSATGKVLWQTTLNASPSSTPITYSVGGRQYVAVVSGGGGPLDGSGGGLTPEIENPAGGTTLVVFALPPQRSRR